MHLQQYWVAVLVSNVAAIILLLASIYRPRAGKILFSLLFVWAAFTNWFTVHSKPEVYLEYSEMALLGIYKNIITGFFARHTILLVSMVAISQFLIGISMLLKGWLFKIGCLGGIVFLLAILPLGIGSGFPCTLILAIGLFIMRKKNNNRFVWEK